MNNNTGFCSAVCLAKPVSNSELNALLKLPLTLRRSYSSFSLVSHEGTSGSPELLNRASAFTHHIITSRVLRCCGALINFKPEKQLPCCRARKEFVKHHTTFNVTTEAGVTKSKTKQQDIKKAAYYRPSAILLKKL